MAALRGAELLAEGLDDPDPPGRLALGSLLSAYAMDSAGYALHHVLCQTIVRMAGSDHAATNACMLPRTLLELVDMFAARDVRARGVARRRAGRAAAGASPGWPEGCAGSRSWASIGRCCPAIAEAAAARSELRSLPRELDASDLLGLLERAW